MVKSHLCVGLCVSLHGYHLVSFLFKLNKPVLFLFDYTYLVLAYESNTVDPIFCQR